MRYKELISIKDDCEQKAVKLYLEGETDLAKFYKSCAEGYEAQAKDVLIENLQTYCRR